MMKKILVKPVISEKSLKLVEELNKYTFVVNIDATKIEVAKEIEKKFNVKVNSVRVINMLGKKVRFGKKRIEGKRNNFKKAIATLKQGESISVFNIK